MRRSVVVGVVLGVVLSVVVVGCVGSVPPGELAQGLTVLEAREGVLSAAYREGDLVIYLQALRGRETPEAYHRDPSAPRYEIDVRFTDDQGRAFYVRRGGDEWVDPTWVDSLEALEDIPPTTRSNVALWDAAAEAVAALGQALDADEAAALAPEIDALRDFGERASALYREHYRRAREHYAVGAAVPALEADGGDVVYGTGGPEDANVSLGAGYYYIELHTEAIYYTFGWGRHSATLTFVWRGYWAAAVDFANHGRSASAMGRACWLDYYVTTAPGDYLPNNWWLTTCKSPYDAYSNSGHNCHDDSRNQMHNFVYVSYNNGWQLWCNDGDNDRDISAWPGDQWRNEPSCTSSWQHGYNYY
jgi:hypothetical protein